MLQITSNEPFDEIYLSPHLDDAVLSCGGRIAISTLANKEVLIVTVAAGDVPAGPLSDLACLAHSFWRLKSRPIEHRRCEDVYACCQLGAQWLHLPIQDAIYARDYISGKPLYETQESLFGVIHPADSARSLHIESLLRTIPRGKQVLVPLGVGSHIDHQLTRLGAESTFDSDIVYYEDYPYCATISPLLFLGGRQADWSMELVPLRETELRFKTNAVAKHRSQVRPIFGSIGAMREQIREQARTVGGERYWRKRLPAHERSPHTLPNAQ